MNDGTQGDKPWSGYAGDAHCVTDGIFFSEIKDGETWSFAVLIMEEDGGTTKPYQQVAAQVLQQIDDPYAKSAGFILSVLTQLGVYATDKDDYIGSFGVRVTNNGGLVSVDWKGVENVSGNQNDPLAPHNQNGHEFRFNGDGSNYVGWFYVR